MTKAKASEKGQKMTISSIKGRYDEDAIIIRITYGALCEFTRNVMEGVLEVLEDADSDELEDTEALSRAIVDQYVDESLKGKSENLETDVDLN